MDTTDFKFFFPFETASATANCAGRWVTPANEYDFFRINNTEIRLLRQWVMASRVQLSIWRPRRCVRCRSFDFVFECAELISQSLFLEFEYKVFIRRSFRKR